MTKTTTRYVCQQCGRSAAKPLGRGPQCGAWSSLLAGLAAGAGYLLAAVVFAGLRERLDQEWAPRAMRGLPLSLVTAGLMSLAFLAFDRTLLAALAG